MEVWSSDCRRGNKHFDVHFWRIRSVHFPSKDGKGGTHEGRNAWQSVYFPPEAAFQPLMLFGARVPFRICTLTWRANNYVSREGKVKIGEMKVPKHNCV